MATIREGNKTVLLVMDMQMGAMQDSYNVPQVITAINKVIDKARTAGVPIIWVQHEDEEFVKGTPDWQYVPELVRADNEELITKHYNSAFEETPLEDSLAKLKATHIVLTGASTNWCIRATAYAALDRGYDLTLIRDAHTTGSIDLKNGKKIEAADIIMELNIAMAWLSYPGRKNASVSSEEVNFSA